MTIRFNWGLGVALAYLAFAAGTIGMVLIASSTSVDLVSPDYYARSLSVDRHLAAVEHGRLVDVRISVERMAGQPALLVTWPAGAIRDPESQITLYRPSAAAADRTLTIGSGDTYSIPLADLMPGRWRAQLQWTGDGREYFVEREFVAP